MGSSFQHARRAVKLTVPEVSSRETAGCCGLECRARALLVFAVSCRERRLGHACGAGWLRRILTGETPEVVRSGAAVLAGSADALAPIAVDVTLPLRNRAVLDAFIADKASHGIYMTQAQFDEQFAPLADQVNAVETWSAEYGLATTYASADGTTITLRGTTANMGRALGVQFNIYHSAQYGTFRSAASDPIVPADLGVSAIVGLDPYPVSTP